MMLKKKVDGLEDYYYQWMNKYKDDADRRLELLKEMGDRCAFCPWCMNHRISTVGEKIHNDDCKLAKELADA